MQNHALMSVEKGMHNPVCVCVCVCVGVCL